MIERPNAPAVPLVRHPLRSLVFDFHNRTILARVGDFIVVTYGLVAALAFVIGFSVGLWYDSMVGQNPVDKAVYYLFFMIPAILLGSRITSVLLEWRELFRRPLQTLVKPGYMLHGGLFGGIAAHVVYSQVSGIHVLQLLDAGAFAMAIGESICRLGCYVYGCCWGRPTESRFGVVYTSPHAKVVRCAPHLRGVKIHPAQVYALLAHLLQFTAFYMLLPYLAFDGMLAGIYLVSHPIIRVLLEQFRQDDRGKLFGSFTHTNLYSSIQALIGIGCLAWGVSRGANPAIDMSVRWVHVWSDPTVAALLVGVGIVALIAFGVHYKKVGAWVDAASAGVRGEIDEMSMGAADRIRRQRG